MDGCEQLFAGVAICISYPKRIIGYGRQGQSFRGSAWIGKSLTVSVARCVGVFLPFPALVRYLASRSGDRVTAVFPWQGSTTNPGTYPTRCRRMLPSLELSPFSLLLVPQIHRAASSPSPVSQRPRKAVGRSTVCIVIPIWLGAS